MEAEPDLGAWLLRHLPGPRRWRLLTDLSNEFGLDRSQAGATTPPLEARERLKNLSGDVTRMANFMDSVAEEGWVIWAPETPSELTKLLTAYRKHLTNRRGEGHFKLVVLLKHAPVAAVAPVLLLDFWRSPAWEPKHEGIVENITILKEPLRCVTSGAISPICAQARVAVVELGQTETAAIPQSRSWKQDLRLEESRDYVIVDVPRNLSVRTERRLRKHAQEAVQRWEGPLPSPGSSKDEPRVVFRGYLAPQPRRADCWQGPSRWTYRFPRP